jgi:hypothetical protein
LKLLFINISIGTKLLFLEQLLPRVGRSKPYTFKIKIPYNKGKKPKSGKKSEKNLTPLGLILTIWRPEIPPRQFPFGMVPMISKHDN